MTKILLINVHSSHNAGDAALTLVTIQQLKTHFPSGQITLSMDDPESYEGSECVTGSLFTWLKDMTPTKKSNWNKGHLIWLLPATLLPVLAFRLLGKVILPFTPRDIKDMVRAYLAADLVVSKPGGFLYTSGSGLTLLLSIYTLALALWAGKPVYIYPQSVGPLGRPWDCCLIRWLMDRVRVVMVRESISLKQIEDCGVSNPNCYLLPDVAFAFPSASQSTGEEWLSDQGVKSHQDHPLLGMTMINWGAQNPCFGGQSQYESACIAAVRFFVGQYKGQVMFFPQVIGPFAVQDDRIPARRVSAQLSDLGEAVRVVEEPLPPALLKAVYGHMDIFIGTRMHSNIFALGAGVPSIAIGYQHKTQGIAQMVGMEQWVLDIKKINGNILIEKLRELWIKRETLRSHIQQIMPMLIRQAEQAGKIVIEDFYNLNRDQQ